MRMYIKKKINTTKEDVFIFNYYCYWIIEKLCIFFLMSQNSMLGKQKSIDCFSQ